MRGVFESDRVDFAETPVFGVSPMRQLVRNRDWAQNPEEDTNRFQTSLLRLERSGLLCEAVGLRHCSDRDCVVNVDPSGLERLAIEFKQSLILHLRFQHLHRGFR